jgi:hypothetical protein
MRLEPPTGLQPLAHADGRPTTPHHLFLLSLVDGVNEKIEATDGAGYVRFSNGTQMCWLSTTTDAGSNLTWTFPEPFADDAYSVQATSTSLAQTRIPAIGSKTAAGCNFNIRDLTGTRISASIDLFAVGTWQV